MIFKVSSFTSARTSTLRCPEGHGLELAARWEHSYTVMLKRWHHHVIKCRNTDGYWLINDQWVPVSDVTNLRHDNGSTQWRTNKM